jgi:hypothetical protein
MPPSAAVVARVNALIANTQSPWEEPDRRALEWMSEAQLDYLTPLVAPRAAGPPPPAGAVLEYYDPPDTLALAVAQQHQLRTQGYVSPMERPPHATTRFRLARKRPGAVPPAPDTFTEIVALQRQLGLRTDPAPTLTTNEACPCQRGARCTCPPDALREVAALQAAQQRALEQADGEWRPLRMMLSA